VEDSVKKRINTLYRFLTAKVVYHTAFWLTLLILLIFLENGSFNLGITIIAQIGQVAFFMVLVYINTMVLVPRYLSKNRIAIYLVYLLILVLLVTFSRVVFEFWLYSDFSSMQSNLIYRNQIIYFFLHLFIAVASTLFVISIEWVRNEREKQELKTEQIQTELKFLKSQINPHFLFNILNSLYALTLKKPDMAPTMVIKLSEMMRYMLYECNEKRVPLDKEINYLRNYLDLERLRIGNKMDIELEVHGDLENKFIAPLIFINFVENAFKHGGIGAKNEKGHVRLDITVENQVIHFVLENSKRMKISNSQSMKPVGGIGLKNVQERLNLVYTNNYAINIREDDYIYSVDLSLLLDNQNI
jgi:two-component system LytT family sensor kinase